MVALGEGGNVDMWVHVYTYNYLIMKKKSYRN